MWGAPYYNDSDKYYVQTNNPTENILSKLIKEGFLESCGSTTGVNCLAVHNYNLLIDCPGSYNPQPEEILNDWFNDPRNYGAMYAIRDSQAVKDIPGNRVPQFYVPAIREVFGIGVKFIWIRTHHDLVDYFKKGCSIQICLKHPSHYVAGVAFDNHTSEIIINDSWPNRYADGNGFNRRFSDYENLENFAIIYPPKENEYENSTRRYV